MIILETEHLLLREMEEGDLPSLRLALEIKEQRLSRWIEWCIASYQKYGFGHWAVVDKSSAEMVGSAGVSMQPIDGQWLPEIGYHLRADHRRRGLGKEMAKAIRDYFFTHFPDAAVYSYMNIDNVASYKTAESMGMTYLSTFVTSSGETCRVYRITREEWESLDR